MGFAVELYFDAHTEQSIGRLRRQLKQKGTAALMDMLGARPHISLAVFSDSDEQRLLTVVREFSSERQPFTLQLGGIGTFPTAENVLFLIPAPSLVLLHWHEEFHAQLRAAGLAPRNHYLPGTWIPHCTVEMNLPAPHLLQAVENLRALFTPLQGEIREIGVVRFRPVQPLATWSLDPVT